MTLLRQSLDFLEQKLTCSRHDSKHIMFVTWFCLQPLWTLHGESFTTSCLPICKHANVKSVKSSLHKCLNFFKNYTLSCRWGEYLIKMKEISLCSFHTYFDSLHCKVFPWMSYMNAWIVLKLNRLNSTKHPHRPS